MSASPVADTSIRCVSFALAGERFGVDVLRVREVLPLPAITSVPGAPSSCLGVLNLRGRILSVLDTRALLGLATAAPGPSAHLLVVESAGRWLGLVIDAIGEVLALPEASTDERDAAGHASAAVRLCHHERGYVGLLTLPILLEELA